ncbi:MAG: hypothetical protein R2911_37140 [Caldilineaceae bacterium]
MAPGIGIFPYLIALGRLDSGEQANAIIFLLAMAGNMMVAIFLVIMSYVVAYFGVLTPDRAVRYRLIRFLRAAGGGHFGHCGHADHSAGGAYFGAAAI